MFQALVLQAASHSACAISTVLSQWTCSLLGPVTSRNKKKKKVSLQQWQVVIVTSALNYAVAVSSSDRKSKTPKSTHYTEWQHDKVTICCTKKTTVRHVQERWPGDTMHSGHQSYEPDIIDTEGFSSIKEGWVFTAGVTVYSNKMKVFNRYGSGFIHFCESRDRV